MDKTQTETAGTPRTLCVLADSSAGRLDKGNEGGLMIRIDGFGIEASNVSTLEGCRAGL